MTTELCNYDTFRRDMMKKDMHFVAALNREAWLGWTYGKLQSNAPGATLARGRLPINQEQ